MTMPSTPTWVDLTRDLVATGAATLDPSLDRLNDLLLLTGQVMGDVTRGSGSIDVTFDADPSEGVTLRVETTDPLTPAPVTDLALSRLADQHWSRPTPGGASIGFLFAV
jgi:hypothetical protein